MPKSVKFSLMVLLNVVISSKCTIHMDYAMDIMFLCERRNLTLDHIYFKVAMHTVLKNAQCTFKNEL